jgi:hypothetical protein
MNAVGFIFALCIPETKGLSLEEMDILFRVVDEPTRRHDIEEHIAAPSRGVTSSISGTPQEKMNSRSE